MSTYGESDGKLTVYPGGVAVKTDWAADLVRLQGSKTYLPCVDRTGTCEQTMQRPYVSVSLDSGQRLPDTATITATIQSSTDRTGAVERKMPAGTM